VNARAVLLLSLSLSALYIVGSQPIVAHSGILASGPSVSAQVTSAAVEPPKPGDSYRITYYNDGQLPSVEGVSTDPKTGQRYWSGPQDPPHFSDGKSLKDHLNQTSKATIEIFDFTPDPLDPPPGAVKGMHAPWNTHCHRTIYIGGVPYIVHC
jgi:hypothetical protein